MDATYVNNHIREELEGSRGYLALYRENGDITVLNMAVDELGHASYFVNKATELPAQLQIMYNEVKANLLAAIEEKEKSDGIGGNIQNKTKE